MPVTVSRFAPSPSGYLHLGHAYGAMFAEKIARKANGRFLLRIEDIDQERCQSSFAKAIFEDLSWLGLQWQNPVRRQSECMNDYKKALGKLDDMGLLYPCFCSRKDIRAEIMRSGQAPHANERGNEGPVYPGICRKLAAAASHRRINAGEPHVLRLDIKKAMQRTGELQWRDRQKGIITANPEAFGDVVLARKDIATSYHLACTIDDHLQGVTIVTRGEDLFTATHIHRLLQELLNLFTPEYQHHRLLVDKDGKRFSKRDKALTIRSLRQSGKPPEEVVEMAHDGDF